MSCWLAGRLGGRSTFPEVFDQGRESRGGPRTMRFRVSQKICAWSALILYLIAIKGTERCRFVLFLGIRGYQMPQLYEYFIRIGVLVTNSPSSIKIRLLRQLSQQTRYGTFFLGHPVGLDITVVNIASPTVPAQRGRREKSKDNINCQGQ